MHKATGYAGNRMVEGMIDAIWPTLAKLGFSGMAGACTAYAAKARPSPVPAALPSSAPIRTAL